MTEQRLQKPPFFHSLSARLLLWTWLAVMLAEFLIYAPSVARFRFDYLEKQIGAAQLVSLAVEASPGAAIDQDLVRQVLIQAGARAIAIRRPGRSVLALSDQHPQDIDKTVDLDRETFFEWLLAPFETMFQLENRVVRVLEGSTVDSRITVEVVMNETPMRKAMYGFSKRIFALSTLISLAAASCVYVGLQILMVQPVRRITDSMVRFRADPEVEEGLPPVSGRLDEIGVAHRELTRMQADLRTALRQKTRLAALGSAMTKINHDLRNSLATAMLVSDRLVHSEDPDVRRVAPRLLNAVDTAVNLCSQTLEFAREQRLVLNRELVYVTDLLEEAEALIHPTIPDQGAMNRGLELVLDGDRDLALDLDRDHMVRVLVNLCRNAMQAGATRLTVAMEGDDAWATIDLKDNGPGMSDEARAKLFQPFIGSSTKGGTGLGLIIARDIVEVHGGSLDLVDSSDQGCHFRIVLPKVVQDGPIRDPGDAEHEAN